MQLTDWGQTLVLSDLPSITNSCTCIVVDDEGNESDTPHCYGDSWDDALAIFAEDTAELRGISRWWRIDGLPLWNRKVGGTIVVEDVNDLIAGLTVNSDWSLRYKVTPTHLWCYLSHHDASGSFTAYPYLRDDADND